MSDIKSKVQEIKTAIEKGNGKGEKVMLAQMEEYYSYGTPEELKRYL